PDVSTIRYLPGVAGREQLVGAVEAAGYDVRPERAPLESDPLPSLASLLIAGDAERDRESRSPPRRAALAIAVPIAIMVAMFVPQTSVPMETINWLVLVPATLVQVWAGARF